MIVIVNLFIGWLVNRETDSNVGNLNYVAAVIIVLLMIWFELK